MAKEEKAQALAERDEQNEIAKAKVQKAQDNCNEMKQ